MKYVILPLFSTILMVSVVVVGSVYTILHFVWSPKSCIEEKKENLVRDDYGKVLWWETLGDLDFWCPFFLS